MTVSADANASPSPSGKRRASAERPSPWSDVSHRTRGALPGTEIGSEPSPLSFDFGPPAGCPAFDGVSEVNSAIETRKMAFSLLPLLLVLLLRPLDPKVPVFHDDVVDFRDKVPSDLCDDSMALLGDAGDSGGGGGAS